MENDDISFLDGMNQLITTLEVSGRKHVRTDNNENSTKGLFGPITYQKYADPVEGWTKRIWPRLYEREELDLQLRDRFETPGHPSHHYSPQKPKEVTARIFEIPGLISRDHFTIALGDYSAKQNFMKEEYAVRLGLSIYHSVSEVTIGNGKKVSTKGTAISEFSFPSEITGYHMSFHLLPRCKHDVILGKPFLELSSTFSFVANFARPVRQRVMKDITQHHLPRYPGDSVPRFKGLVGGNGIPQDMLADSGAKISFMDESYARSLGMPIHKGKKPAESNSKYLKNRKPKEVTTRIFEIPGHLSHTHLTNALGDYCAKQNFMKEEYAIRLGLSIDHSEVSEVTIGNGKKVSTKGTAKTLFSFAGEITGYQLTFHLLPSCIHDVILGKPFLKATHTFKSVANFARRVRQRVMRGVAQHRLLYLGDSAPRFKGLVNGIPQDALADSGAKVSVMDEDYARSLGIPIHRGEEHRTRLRFADSSTAHTSGMAYDVKWEFGSGEIGEEHRLDFHILRDAPANVILRDTFLFDVGAFSKYDCFLVDDDEEDEEGYFFAIDVDQSNPGEGHLNMSSLANIRHAENVLRGQKEDAIANLPQDKQAIARQAENERRSRWERRFAALQLCQTSGNGALFVAAANPSASFSSPQGIQVARHERFWSRFKLKRKSPS